MTENRGILAKLENPQETKWKTKNLFKEKLFGRI